jgi:hypothetical protein
MCALLDCSCAGGKTKMRTGNDGSDCREKATYEKFPGEMGTLVLKRPSHAEFRHSLVEMKKA